MLFLRGNLTHSTSNSRVTTRERGVIPGCIPAVDVFVERTQDEVRDMITADPYWKVWDDYRLGVMGWQEWKNHPIHKRKLYTPFRNPSVSHFNRYD